jgi:hypothetical protein
MIDTYDKQTGEAIGRRKSLQILQEEIGGLRAGKKTLAEKNKRTDAGSNRKNANGCN